MSDVRQQSFEGEIKKCPNCGSVVKSFSAFCSDCGHEFKNSEQSKALKEFTEKLEEFQAFNNTEQIIGLIETFSIPNSKEDLLEFLILASSNIDGRVIYRSDYNVMHTTPEFKTAHKISKAWLSKFEQAYRKAQIVLINSPEFSKVEAMNDKIEQMQKKAKRKSKQPLIIILVFILAFGVFLTIKIKGVDEKKEIARLQSIESKIEKCISKKDYAAALANALKLDTDMSSIDEEYEKKQEKWIKLIKELEEKNKKENE